MIVKCPLLVGVCSPVLAFEVLDLLWLERVLVAFVASVAFFVLTELVVWGIVPARLTPVLCGWAIWIKKLC